MKKNKKTGFTLIEMIVAVGVFAVAVVVSLTAFLNVSDIQKKAESLRIVNDNLNFSIETMLREIRTSSDYQIGTGGESLTVTDVFQGPMTYRLNNERIEKSVNGGPFVALTAPETTITKLAFFVKGEQAGDQLQPSVTIVITGSAGEKEKIKTYLELQTTVSQRKLDS